jgi:hypothetical protein
MEHGQGFLVCRVEIKTKQKSVAVGRGTKQLLYVRRQTLVAPSPISTAKTRRSSVHDGVFWLVRLRLADPVERIGETIFPR